MTRVEDQDHPTRAERRRRTEALILDAARESFAEAGFERTTIRGVAARAHIDPALVMQYYGSKEGLFAAAARWPADRERVLGAERDAVPEAALADVFHHFESASEREAVIALMRNCLTHPEASRVMRDEVMCERAATVAATIGGEDAELRSGLIGACLMGLVMSRYLLHIEPTASAGRADVERLLLPALRALVDPPA